MKYSGRNILAAGLVALASHAVAQVGSVCPTTDVCFKLSIPERTASSGNGDVFFQLSAPSSYQYVALGQGSSMSGSNIFVVYTSGNGNVTLSPRLGTGERMPQFNSDAQVTLLEGSGVSGGKMIANVRCSSCNSWSGGSASFSGNNGNWIYATHQSGGPIDSTSQSENIAQHDDHAAFQWSYANAKGGNSVNPLLAAAGSGSASGKGSGSGSTPTSCVPRPAGAAVTGTTTGTASRGAGSRVTSTRSDDDDSNRATSTRRGDDDSAHPTGNSGRAIDSDFLARDLAQDLTKRQDINYCDSDDPANSGFTPITVTSSEAERNHRMLIAHGTLAALAFVIFFPFGAIAIRLASFTGVIWFHAAFQLFAYILYIVAFGLGVNLAREFDLLSHAHPVIGMLVFSLLFFQPIFGFLHHWMYKKYQTRTFSSHIHLWLGRIAITLGIINGGLGLQLADKSNLSSRGGMIAYGVIAGVIWLAWVGAVVVGERKRSMARDDGMPKGADSPREVSEAGGRYASS